MVTGTIVARARTVTMTFQGQKNQFVEFALVQEALMEVVKTAVRCALSDLLWPEISAWLSALVLLSHLARIPVPSENAHSPVALNCLDSSWRCLRKGYYS